MLTLSERGVNHHQEKGLYTMLGVERAKTTPPEGGKHVILLRKKDDAFLSVYDSDHAAFC